MKSRDTLFRILLLALGCFGVLPGTHAVVPAPDGGYPGGNTAEGQNALFSLTSGTFNTAIGFLSLRSNTEGIFNTAIGAGTLLANTGDENTATGASALEGNTTGFGNTANGVNALGFNTTGSNNIALGVNAGVNLSTGNNNIDIGHTGFVPDADTIRIGTSGFQTSTFIAGIRGVTTGNMDAIAVLIDTQGQLGTISSSRRYKKEIKPMDKASESILALKPVTFHYKSDNKDTPQFGLIAEEVAEVNPELVVRDADGEIYTVRYDAVNAMLLNEFLKEHRKVRHLEANAARQQQQIDVLSAGLQRVSAQLERSKPAPQIVANDR